MKSISVSNTCQNIANLYVRGIILSNPGIEIYPEKGTCKKTMCGLLCGFPCKRYIKQHILIHYSFFLYSAPFLFYSKIY